LQPFLNATDTVNSVRKCKISQQYVIPPISYPDISLCFSLDKILYELWLELGLKS